MQLKTQNRIHFNRIQAEVLRFTNGKSTSISKENYLRVVDFIHFIFEHGQSYEEGVENIKRRMQECKDLYRSICSYGLEEYNAALYDVLKIQIPNIFQSWNERVCWCEMHENLDYPLVDGIPLLHDMYDLKGVDLVFYYLKRLKKEMDFVKKYKDELLEFVQCLDVYTQESWNMYSLVLYQSIANQVLKGKNTILLSKKDVEEFQNRNVDILCYFFDGYMKTYQDPLLNSFQLFYQKEYEESRIFVQDIHNDYNFNSMVEYLRTLSLEEKINYVLKENLGVHDLLDILNTDVFIETEYISFFKTLDMYSLALLYKYREEKWEGLIDSHISSLDTYEEILKVSDQIKI